ncbi:MAG: class I SAM-dependent methyltransferase [Sphingobacteriales bacterium]|nr:MAG: class I SAM-dependent methyltransferase [Sphingobacteriales bacterium]
MPQASSSTDFDLAKRIPPTSKSVLELACGTGRVTGQLHRRLKSGARLVASDLNNDMLQVARTVVYSPRVEWVVADAHRLPFGNGVFDLVVCQFGVMFFQQKPLAIAEIARVLQPGGCFLFNTWDSIRVNPRAALIQQVLREELGEEARDFSLTGPYSFFDKGVIAALLKEACFLDVVMEQVKEKGCFSSITDIVEGFVEGSPLGLYLDRFGAALRGRVKRKLGIALEKEFSSGGISMKMEAIVIRCVKGH